MKKKIAFVGLILSLTLLLTGCYELEGGFSFNEAGEASVLIDINADEFSGGEEARILAWQLEFLFPELDLEYDKTIESTTINYQDFVNIKFTSKERIDLSNSNYFVFEEKDDGSFEFLANIPAVLDSGFQDSVYQDTQEEVILNFFVELPKDIDMANSTRVTDNRVEWRLTREDLTSEVQLRAFTY